MNPGDKVKYVLTHHGKNGHGTPAATEYDAEVVEVDGDWIKARLVNSKGVVHLIKKNKRQFKK
jgi:hypothetical protein